MNKFNKLITTLKSINLHQIIKTILFICCFIISVYLMIQLTTSLSINPSTKSKLTFVAIVAESAAMFAFLKAKFLWKKGKWQKGKSKNRLIAILLFFIYTLYVIMAINSAIGYFNMELTQQNTIAEKIEKGNDREQREYDQNANQIEMYQQQYAKETDRYGKRSKELEKNIQDLQKSQRELNAALKKVEKNTDNTPKNILFYLSKVYNNLPQNVLSIYIFGIIAFIAFAGQIITAPDLPDEKEKEIGGKTDEPELSPLQQKMITYVVGLFDGRKAYGTEDDERLNGDSVVSEKTEIPVEECNQFREYLKGLRINGNGMALRSGQGGTYSNYPKEKIINYIKTHDVHILL